MQRYQEITTVGAATTTLIEVNALFEVQYSSTTGHTEYRASIVGGTGVVAIRTIRDDGVLTTRYITGNHLGGVSVITDEVGTVDERMSYGAFGERRDPVTWQPYASTPDLTDITDKGYTGQQQLDAVGLIHMNGRVYDPEIGRFISADPTVPDPLDSQSFARYAYVENNPLSAIDPSGFETDHYMWDVVTSSWDCYTGNYNPCSAPGPKLTPTKIAADSGNGTVPSPVPTVETPIPPAPNAPPPPQQQQQQQTQQQNPCATHPTGACYGDTGAFATDSCQVINCGGDDQVLNIINSTDGFVTWDGSVFNWGPSPIDRAPRELIEIPSPGAPTGGGPTAGPNRAPGSGGVPMGGAYNPGNPDYHHYQFEDPICLTVFSYCTPQNVFQGSIRYPFPGASGVPIRNGSTHDIAFLGINGGPVKTYIDPGSLTIENITEPGHIFYNGKVTRTVVVNSGVIYIQTTGVGVDQNQFLKLLNVETARPGFMQVDAEIAWWALTHH